MGLNIYGLLMEECDGCLYIVIVLFIIKDWVYLVGIMCKICIMFYVFKVCCCKNWIILVRVKFVFYFLFWVIFFV